MKKKPQKSGAVNEPKPQIEVKLIKHTFSPAECDDLGMTMARAHSALVDINGEFDQIKSSFKARITEQESIGSRAAVARLTGFEMRNARCRVVFRPKDGQKDYYLEFAGPKDAPVLTEPMTGPDMQANLLPEEPKFEAGCEIELWDAPEDGLCTMKVGRLTPELCGRPTAMWFCALNVRVGEARLLESLDNGQPCATKRIDIIRRAAKRLKAWLAGTLGAEAAEGFDAKIDQAVDAQKEREE